MSDTRSETLARILCVSAIAALVAIACIAATSCESEPYRAPVRPRFTWEYVGHNTWTVYSVATGRTWLCTNGAIREVTTGAAAAEMRLEQ